MTCDCTSGDAVDYIRVIDVCTCSISIGSSDGHVLEYSDWFSVFPLGGEC